MTLPKTQTGYGFVEGTYKINKFTDLPVPTPQNSEVLLKIEAAGICHSDLDILKVPNINEKFVMGHEIAGQIVAVGNELADHELYAIGKRFSVVISNSCGVCDSCRAGNDNSCYGSNKSGYGINMDGGFQEYLLIKNLRTLVEIPDGVSYEQAAITTDSVITPLHAILKVKDQLQPGKKVLVIGLGGLGLNAVQILRNFGCQIIVTDRKASLRERALANGANDFVEDIEACLDHLPDSFDVVFDFCGYRQTFQLAQKFVTVRGKIVMVGLGNFKLEIGNFPLAQKNVTVYFNFGGTAANQQDAMKWVELGKIKPIYTVRKLDEIAQCLDDLKKGKIEGRVVLKAKL